MITLIVFLFRFALAWFAMSVVLTVALGFLVGRVRR
jgi:hypothetical protein